MTINSAMYRLVRLLVGVFVSASLASAAMAQISNDKVHVDIPAQSLSTALTQFGRDTGTEIVFTPEAVNQKVSTAIKGDFAREKAISLLLGGTGLTYRVTAQGAIVINVAPGPKASGAGLGAADQARLAHSSASTQSQPVPGNPQNTNVATSQSSTSSDSEKDKISEIVVTGTHIRGVQAAGSKLIVIDREQIDSSGYGRVQDVLATLTQNFSGVSESNTIPGGGIVNNNRGSEVQLRGLGAGTTLTLVNGQRQAVGGDQGTFTDVSSIPTSAIERIEVLPDGASALYGSDAIGGVVNIILRNDFEGFETRVRGGTANGDANELLLAQIWGHSWSSGHVLVGYQYNDRGALPCSARAYCAANSNYLPFGGSDYRTIGGNPGTILDPNTSTPVAAIPRGQNGTNLTQAQLIPGAVNYSDLVTYNEILPKQTMQSAFLNASYDVTSNWDLSADGRYASRTFSSFNEQPTSPYIVPSANAFNHLGGDVLVAYDLTKAVGPVRERGNTNTISALVGLTGKLAGGWQLKVSGGYSKETNFYLENNILDTNAAIPAALASSDPTSALNIFGDGSQINPATRTAIANQIFGYNESWTTTSASVIGDGALFNAPAGAIRLAVGADYRKEKLTSHYFNQGPLDGSRNVRAFFGELAVPILGSDSAAGKLDLSLAGRYERYSDFGSTTNPKVGMSWRPASFVQLRGTWGTSFRAPPFWQSQIVGYSSAADIPDPQSQASNGLSHVLGLFGPIRNLQPETAHVWTAGLDFTPPAMEKLSLSFTYFDIDYRNKIQYPGGVGQFLTVPAIYAPVTIRNPTQAQIDAICNSPSFTGGGCNQPIAAIVDNRIRNLSVLQTHGLDADLGYGLETAYGFWHFGLRGTYTFAYDTQILSTAPVHDVINTVNNPLKLRLSGNLSWSLAGWTVQATANHAGSYFDPSFTPARKVDSWTTADLNAGYRVVSSGGWLADTQFNFGIINLFDRNPPFVNQFSGAFAGGSIGYDNSNASLIGRQFSLQVVKAWGK